MINSLNPQQTLELARQVLTTEADAVRALAGRLDQNFYRAVELILACRGRVVVSGAISELSDEMVHRHMAV